MPGAEAAAAVLDASVAVKWLIDEPASADAAALLERDLVWHAPRLLLTECASVLRRKAASGEIEPLAAVAALNLLLDAVTAEVVRLADDEDHVAPALAAALATQHRLPDCLYLALAEREGAALATADARLAGLARARGVAVLGVGAAA
jgi:predicted nucleic acid-binding protein